jgi:hypothetical protein
MLTRSRPTARTAGRLSGLAAVVTALCVAVGVATGPAPERAGAAGSLEDLVGPIDATVRAQLPADPRLYGAYTLRTTPDTCANGSYACIDKTLTDMRARFAKLAPACDHDAVFSLLYLRVTERYKVVAATPGYFISPRTVNYEDAVFYNLYAGAYREWHANRPGSVPPAWRLAFAAADAKQVSGSGDVLLGVSAHILRDLPFTLERVARVQRADHLAINPMLRSVYKETVAELARRFDPTISLADTVPGQDKLVVDVLAEWRDQAWRDGQELLAAPDAASRRAIADRIERDAWANGLSIYLGYRYPVQSATVTRDAYCATHWNT